MKKFVIYLIGFIVICVIGIFAAYFLAKKYEPEVRDIILYELNRNLDVEVKVADINFSLLQRFPYASLRFSEVVIPQVRDGVQSDTLIYIKDLYLQIGLFDFLRQNYRVSEAEINQGFFHMDLYADGTDNYHFWKAAEDTISKAELSLSNIEIKSFAYRLRSGDDLEIALYVEKGEANGNFGSDVYDISSDSRIHINQVIASADTMFKNQIIDGEIVLHIDQIKKIYAFESDDISLGKEDFQLLGNYDLSQSPGLWNVNLSTTNAKIENLAEIMPTALRQATRSYKARGRTDLVVQMNTTPKGHFDVDVVFDKTQGTFQHNVALGTAKIKTASGSLQVRSNVTSLYIDDLIAGIGPGEVKARGKIVDFGAPAFDLNLSGSMDLEELKNFLNVPSVERMEGKLRLNGRLQGKLPRNRKDETITLLKGIDFLGDIKLSDGLFKIKNQGQTFEKINGDIDLRNNALIINNATALVNGSSFEISGALENALPYLSSEGQKLHIKAQFKSPSLDFNDIWVSETTKADTTYRFHLPDDVSFDLGVDIGKINFRRFEAVGVTGKAQYQNGLLTLNPFTFKSASGVVRANASVERLNATTYLAKTRAHLENIAIDQLFYQFENFDQNVVRSTHLEGRTNAQITFSGTFGQNLSFREETIQAQIDLMIIKGKLKKLESFQAIADYLKESTVWRSLVQVDAFEKKLQMVVFDTLQNSIRIENKMVLIPAMKIGSSAMTINLSGQHSFNNDIDYSINFRLSELLRSGKKQNDDFGYIVEDQAGLRLFMQMTGTTDNPIFSLDKEAARDKRKRELEKEKNVFKSILKEEFGLYKGDTTLQGVPTTPAKQGTRFSVEWDEFNEDSVPKTQNKPPRSIRKSKKTKDDDKIYDDFDSDDDL